MSFLSPALCVLFKGILPCVAPHSDVPRSWELSHVLLQIALGSVFGCYIFPSQRLFLLCLFLIKDTALGRAPVEWGGGRGESNSCLANQIIQTNLASEPEHLHTIPFGVPCILLEIVDTGLCYIYFWFIIKKDLGFHLLKMFKSFSTHRARERAMQFKVLMILPRTWVLFPMPMSGGSQRRVTPPPGDPISSSVLMGTWIHVHIPIPTS